jgi:ABC-2 type transport system ATP-binding protein
MLLGLVTPTSGTATIGGRDYRSLERPVAVVGAALEAASFHPGRSGRDSLRVHALAGGVDAARVHTVLDTVGLTDYAGRRVGGYSLGMRQRLGLATALLGDPGVLVLDEPINGLDPEGIKWIRGFLRSLAGEGRTVLVSSHLLSEVHQTVDEVVIIAKGRLVHSGPLSSLETMTGGAVVVDSPDRAALLVALHAGGLAGKASRDGIVVPGADPAAIGHLAFRAGVELSALYRESGAADLESSFLALVGEEGAL